MVNMRKINPEYRKYYDLLQEFSKVIHFGEQSIDERWNKLLKYFSKRAGDISELFANNPDDYYCLQKPKTTTNASPYGQCFMKKCSKIYDSLDEMFVIKPDGKIMTNENLCLDSFKIQTSEYSSEKGRESLQFAKMVSCSTKSTQYFTYNTNVRSI